MLMLWLVGLLAVGFFTVALVLKRMNDVMQQILKLHDAQQQQPAISRDLTRQVDEIHQTMGGVINHLKAVGTQVHHLNLLAGHALQGVQQSAHQDEEQHPSPQIMIELRPASAREAREPQVYASFEDMPPEMQQKFRVFQAVYSEMMSHPDLPSRKMPDQN